MPKLKPKLPLASAVGESTFELGHSDWQRIERAYRHKLPDDVREKIRDATQLFIEGEKLECSAEPSLAAKTRIGRYKRAAEIFSRNLRVPSKGEGDDARTYADYLVEKHFDCSQLSGSRKLDTLPIVAVSLIVACKKALNELDELASEQSGYQSGDSWNEWIRQLTAIVKQHCLRRGARTDDSDQPSDFVELVRALQNHPLIAGRGQHSGQALAQRIKRARGKDKKTKDKKTRRRRQRAQSANRAKQDAANNAAAIAEDKREVQSLLDQIDYLIKRHKDEAGDRAKQNLVEITASIKNGTAKLTLLDQIDYLTQWRDALLTGRPDALGEKPAYIKHIVDFGTH